MSVERVYMTGWWKTCCVECKFDEFVYTDGLESFESFDKTTKYCPICKRQLVYWSLYQLTMVDDTGTICMCDEI
jgi:hypothetical protein